MATKNRHRVDLETVRHLTILVERGEITSAAKELYIRRLEGDELTFYDEKERARFIAYVEEALRKVS